MKRTPPPRLAKAKPDAGVRGKFYLTYPKKLVKEPLIYQMSRKFELVFNVRSASVSEELGIETEDAYNMVYRLGREEGLLLGQSSGAAQVAALEVARGLSEGTVVVLFPDFGDRYLSTNLWIGWGKLGGTTP